MTTTGFVSGAVRAVVLPDGPAIAALLSGRTGDLRRTLAGFAGLATVEARRLADQRLRNQTGRYKASIRSSFTDHGFRIEADVPYAATLELGSRPHPIVARRAPQLSFYWEKRGVWFKGVAVRHPGQQQPKLIITDGVLNAARRIGL